MRGILIALVLLGAVLAGCTTEPEPASVPTGDAADDTDTGNETVGPDGAEDSGGDEADDGADEGGDDAGDEADDANDTDEAANTPPAISLTVNQTQVEAGTELVFTLDASDEDGDDLEWAFDVDFEDPDYEGMGTGDELPIEISYVFETAGAIDVGFYVFDGTDEVAEEIVITVTEAAGGGDVPEPIVFTADAIEVPAFGCAPGGPGTLTGDFYFYFDAAISGTWLYFLDTEGTTEWWAGDAGNGAEGSAGVIPAGSDNVSFCGLEPGTEFTLTLYHPDYVLE